MTKKIRMLVSVMCIAALLLVGCGSKAESDGEAPTDLPEAIDSSEMTAEQVDEYIFAESSNPDKVVIRWASIDNNFDEKVSNHGLREFFRILKDKLGDKVEVQVFWGGALGSTTDANVSGLQNGSFEMINWALGSCAELTNAFQPLDIPYLFTSHEDAYNFLGGPAGEVMRDKCVEDTGLIPVMYNDIGMRVLTNSKKEVALPADLKGLKVRTQSNNLHILAFNTLGAAATPISMSELYTSLQQGVVDGQENPISNIYATKFGEVQKFLTRTNHLYTAQAVIMSGSFYDSLSDEFKAAIAEASAAGTKVSYESICTAETEQLKELSSDMQITELTDEQINSWQDAAKVCWPEMRKVIGADYLDSVLQAGGISLE